MLFVLTSYVLKTMVRVIEGKPKVLPIYRRFQLSKVQVILDKMQSLYGENPVEIDFGLS